MSYPYVTACAYVELVQLHVSCHIHVGSSSWIIHSNVCPKPCSLCHENQIDLSCNNEKHGVALVQGQFVPFI